MWRSNIKWARDGLQAERNRALARAARLIRLGFQVDDWRWHVKQLNRIDGELNALDELQAEIERQEQEGPC